MPGGTGITFVNPRSGFRGTARFFIVFAIFWLGISGVVFIAFLISALQNLRWEEFLPLVFISGFVMIGVLFLGVAIQLALARSVLLATREGVVFTTKGPFRAAEWQVAAGDIREIVAGPSGTTINDKALLQVQVRVKGGGKDRAFFTGLSDEEIFWVATRVRTFYAIQG